MLHIIDSSVLVYRIVFALAPLTINQILAKANEAIYLEAVDCCIKSIDAEMKEGDQVVWLGDSNNYFRKEIYPLYKSGRVAKPDVYYQIIKRLNEVKKVLCISGFEADDLIAAAAYLKTKVNEPARIWTTDCDLMQLIDDNITWFNVVAPMPNHKQTPRLRTPDNFTEYFVHRGFGRKHWELKNPHEAVTSIKYNLGDKSDNFPRHCDPALFDLRLSPIFDPNLAGLDMVREHLELNSYPADLESGFRNKDLLVDNNMGLPVHPIAEPTAVLPYGY